MKVSVEKSPFSANAWIVSNETMVLCDPEIEGGLPIQWASKQGAEGMAASIEVDGLGEYQMLYKTTATNRLTGE